MKEQKDLKSQSVESMDSEQKLRMIVIIISIILFVVLLGYLLFFNKDETLNEDKPVDEKYYDVNIYSYSKENKTSNTKVELMTTIKVRDKSTVEDTLKLYVIACQEKDKDSDCKLADDLSNTYVYEEEKVKTALQKEKDDIKAYNSCVKKAKNDKAKKKCKTSYKFTSEFSSFDVKSTVDKTTDILVLKDSVKIN